MANMPMNFPIVTPERMGLYYDRKDIETYLKELWPDIPLERFRIRVSHPPASDYAAIFDTFRQENDDRMHFTTPREFTEDDWK